jgi:hypothetical protein
LMSFAFERIYALVKPKVPITENQIVTSVFIRA